MHLQSAGSSTDQAIEAVQEVLMSIDQALVSTPSQADGARVMADPAAHASHDFAEDALDVTRTNLGEGSAMNCAMMLSAVPSTWEEAASVHPDAAVQQHSTGEYMDEDCKAEEAHKITVQVKLDEPMRM